MVQFEQTWRWFGPNDRITLADIKQTGATGIVTALHQIPVGDEWTVEKINERKAVIEAHGLRWSVVESVPVSEAIKKQSQGFETHIENYKKTITNLAKCGIKTVCYNFMPILDWTRTQVAHKRTCGSESLKYEYHQFVAFDLLILKRQGAKNDYTPEVIKKATDWFNSISSAERAEMETSILMGLPGSLQTYTLDELKELLQGYAHIDKAKLKEHLKYFLQQVVPVAEANGVKLAIHPDDPPWSQLGLPRIVGNADDLRFIVESVPSPANGITLCTGSLGAGHFNNLTNLAQQFKQHVNFAHLRNVTRTPDHDFMEDNFFDGDINMVEVVTILLKEMKTRQQNGDTQWQIPMRPDHGYQMLGDIGQNNYPGYGLYGRMKSLAEFRGLEIGVLANMGN
jgi:mannonate dehydratase